MSLDIFYRKIEKNYVPSETPKRNHNWIIAILNLDGKGTARQKLISIHLLGEDVRDERRGSDGVSKISRGSFIWRGVERGATYEISGGSVLTLPTGDG